MSDSFKPGDVVQLNSGGPRMTVSAIGSHGVSCEWFIGGEVQRASFNAATLSDPRKTVAQRVL